MTKFHDGDFVRQESTGHLGRVIFVGRTGGAQVDFPTYGSSLVIDDDLTIQLESLETFVLGLRLDGMLMWEENGVLKMHGWKPLNLETMYRLGDNEADIIEILKRNEWSA